MLIRLDLQPPPTQTIKEGKEEPSQSPEIQDKVRTDHEEKGGDKKTGGVLPNFWSHPVVVTTSWLWSWT